MNTHIELQYETHIQTQDIEKIVKDHLKQRGIKLHTIDTLNIYYKPKEKAIYYVAIDKNGIIYGTNNTPIII